MLNKVVIPANAGIQAFPARLDPGFCRDEGEKVGCGFLSMTFDCRRNCTSNEIVARLVSSASECLQKKRPGSNDN
jgi:hypothetical protein